MAWTVKMLAAEERETFWYIVVEFTDSVTLEVKPARFRFTGTTTQELRKFLTAEAAKFEKADTSFDFSTLKGQSVDVTPLPPVVPDPPTQAELDRKSWFADWRLLTQYNELVSNGISPPGIGGQINSLQASLLSDWDNSYIGGI